MRLAQAARKLSITTEDIIDFLEIRGIIVERDSNTKLEEEAVKLLYKHFEIEDDQEIEEVVPEPVEAESDSENQAIENTEIDTFDADEVQEETVPERNEAEEDPEEEQQALEKKSDTKKSFKTVTELLEDEENSDAEFIIKAPKVELKGLNVVGKIDLPEPKPKPDPKPKAELKERKDKALPKTRPVRKARRNQQRELSPAEIRRREEQKEARKQERFEKEKKRKREQFYKEKVLKPQQLEQKSKPRKKKKVEIEEERRHKPKPKTLLGKFWRWLNT